MPLSWIDILNKPIFYGDYGALGYSREEAESELFAWQNVQFNFDEMPGTASLEWDDKKSHLSSPTSSISSAASSTSPLVPPAGWPIPGRLLAPEPEEPSLDERLAAVSQQTAVAKQDTPAAKFHAYPPIQQQQEVAETSYNQRYEAARDSKNGYYAPVYRSQPIRATFLLSQPAPAQYVKPFVSLPQAKEWDEADAEDEEERHPLLEDRKRRNTLASARFRAKKKEREQAVEKLVDDLQDRAFQLEAEMRDLKRENEWLKSLIVVKQPRRVASQDPFEGLASDEEPERGRRRHRA